MQLNSLPHVGVQPEQRVAIQTGSLARSEPWVPRAASGVSGVRRRHRSKVHQLAKLATAGGWPSVSRAHGPPIMAVLRVISREDTICELGIDLDLSDTDGQTINHLHSVGLPENKSRIGLTHHTIQAGRRAS